MGSNPVVPMHQEKADIALGFLGGSVTQSRYPFGFQAAEHALHRRVEAPMSTDVPRFIQIGQNQGVQISNDVALQTSLNFLEGQSLSRSTRYVGPGSWITALTHHGYRPQRIVGGSTPTTVQAVANRLSG